LNDNFNGLGFAIIGVLLGAWILSYGVYKAKGLDTLEATRSDPL
jgi:high-affinity nickel-transport protein